jgi:UDP-N-acetylglucosamine 4-epimerase
MQLMNHETITNGDGNYSRDFTYIENVIQMNECNDHRKFSCAKYGVYNTAFGDRNTLNDLVNYLKEYLAKYDPAIADAEVAYGPNRVGDIPHSLASIAKAKELLGYNPQFSLQQGLKEAIDWYWNNLK